MLAVKYSIMELRIQYYSKSIRSSKTLEDKPEKRNTGLTYQKLQNFEASEETINKFRYIPCL